MPPANRLREALARELCDLAGQDEQVRAELGADGSLFLGYHPRMEAVHRRNAARLAAIVDEVGWPTELSVGPEAAEAAWLIAQHAILEADDQGWLRPYPIEDPAGVDERRQRVGLAPLVKQPARAERVMSGEERAAYEQAYQAWLRRAGWRE